MTGLQQKRAAALFAVRRADLWHENNFVNQMSAWASLESWQGVTPKQDAYLEKLCWKYREQLAAAGHQDIIPESDPREKETV
jgi:hypothetical protein